MIIEAATVGVMYMAEVSPTKSPADYLNPISVVVTVADKVTSHYEEKNKPKPKLILSKEKQDKFDKMSKEDWLKDDPHKNMWDPNWIKKE
jgi:hypothetical protein